jgi:hypothetical protein
MMGTVILYTMYEQDAQIEMLIRRNRLVYFEHFLAHEISFLHKEYFGKVSNIDKAIRKNDSWI